MKFIVNYISGFLNRSGGYVFLATVFARVVSFLTSWMVLQLLPNKALGEVLYAWNIISFLMPFVGFGLYQSYIRYGALLGSKEEKEIMVTYVIKYGVLTSGILTLLVGVTSLLFPFALENVSVFLGMLSLVFIPFFLLEVIKAKARLYHKNKKVAGIEVVYTLLLFVMVGLGSYFFKEKGYALTLVIVPLMTVVLYGSDININWFERRRISSINSAFWKYGMWGGLNNVATMLLFAIDILFIGNLLQLPEKVTAYKYISMLPMSILFLPRVFMTTDFVTMTENISSKSYVYTYIKSYMTLFGVISFFYVLLFYLFDRQVLLFFDSTFVEYQESFFILNIGICGILIFRGLFGNLLSSIGRMKTNYYIMFVALGINIFSNNYLIPVMGVKGAAITSASLMWFTGLSTCMMFFYYYRNTNIN